MDDYPVIWALVCVASQSIEYTSVNKSAVDGFYRSMPDEVRDLFVVIEYRAFVEE